MTALSEPMILTGQTKAFSGYGRSLGYPTANLRIGTELDDGVYFGTASLDKYQDQPALIFIGTPVTMGDTERRVEAHLLDIPDRDYYGSQLRIKVMHFYRGNQKLGSAAELKQLMGKDETAARRWFEGQGLAKPSRQGDTG